MLLKKCDLCAREIPLGEGGRYKLKIKQNFYDFGGHWVHLDVCEHCQDTIVKWLRRRQRK